MPTLKEIDVEGYNVILNCIESDKNYYIARRKLYIKSLYKQLLIPGTFTRQDMIEKIKTDLDNKGINVQTDYIRMITEKDQLDEI